LRRRGNEFEDFEPEKKKEKKNHGLFPDFQQESAKTESNQKVSEDSNPSLRIKPGENQKTYLFILMNNNESKST